MSSRWQVGLITLALVASLGLGIVGERTGLAFHGDFLNYPAVYTEVGAFRFTLGVRPWLAYFVVSFGNRIERATVGVSTSEGVQVKKEIRYPYYYGGT